jgi:hypothetical protein
MSLTDIAINLSLAGVEEYTAACNMGDITFDIKEDGDDRKMREEKRAIDERR